MSDNMTREERSKQMALVKNKNTKPEVELKHLFWKLGYHYRYSNWSKLPGKPDLVFVKSSFLARMFLASPSRLFEYTSTQKQC